MKKFFEKKWLVLSCLAILVLALVIGIVALTGGGEKDPNPTEGTSNVGDPTETTGGNGDNTDPSDDPSDATEPEIPTDPAAPSDPVIEPTISPADPTLPTDPEGDPVLPTDPDTGEVAPSGPADLPSETFPKEEEYDFGGVTAGTIRATDWDSWDSGKQQAFLDIYFTDDMTPEDRHNFLLATWCDDYDCGFEGHACRGDLHHESVMAGINAGCMYCGKHDCPSLLAVNPEDLFTEPDPTVCPEYDITKDPMEYCQICKRPVNGEPGTICIIYQGDGNCYACGAWIKAWTCHCCDPDDLD